MQADPESKAKSLLDMLHKIPFITVDAQDNVSLKGSTNFKVFINGRPSAMMDNNLKAVLRTMPASSIQRIEVITNPPAILSR
jgi:ferric enterobactin receptor